MYMFVFILMLASVDGRAVSNLTRLHDDLFDGYRRQVRPVVNDTNTINLRVRFWFKQILAVDEGDQILTVYCWLEMVCWIAVFEGTFIVLAR